MDMKITIISIANKMPNWVSNSCDEYLKRINHGKYSCKLVEIKAHGNAKHKTAFAAMAAEAKQLKPYMIAGNFTIALDEQGKHLTSVEFAKQLDLIALNTPNISFIIGGDQGIHPEIKLAANLNLSLSNLTFPHGLVRILILEQIYRMTTILDGHPYHRG